MLLQQSFKGLNDAWRYLIGIFLIFLGYFVGQMPLYGVIYYKIANNSEIGKDDLFLFEKNMDFSIFGMDKNSGFVLLLLMFVVALLSLWLVTNVIHHKEMRNFITPNRPVHYQKIMFGFLFWLVLSLILEGVSYMIWPEDYTFTWQGSSFIILLVISVFLLPIQTSFEELFFRGYIMQGIGFFARKKWMAILGSSIFFGLVHGTNPEIDKYGYAPMMIYYVMAGIFLAVITVLDDSLELALGVHAATNFVGATLFTYQGSVLQTDSLFMTQNVKPWVMIFGFAVSAVIFIIVCKKRYLWPELVTIAEDIEPETANVNDGELVNVSKFLIDKDE